MDGRPKRPCGAAQIFAVDFFKCGQHGSGMELVMGAWKSLDDSTKRRYEAAAAMVKKDFLDKHSYYVNKRAGSKNLLLRIPYQCYCLHMKRY